VDWQRRGVVTASVGFVRTMGSALGVGLLGALFNVLVAPDMAKFRAAGIAPASLLDPKTYDTLPAGLRASLQQTISDGLLWVFAAMVAMAVAQLVMTTMLPRANASTGESEDVECASPGPVARGTMAAS
jgi:hypothetical protein